ncbi:MAG: outer membrane beta-barrel protein [Planctomycetes bacterium]|nr:outer membrane beta-barrel protein [Planctomycetota bacterium]
MNDSSLYIAKIRSHHQNVWTGNLNLVAGNSKFTRVAYSPVPDQATAGFNFDIGKKSWLVNFAVDYHMASASATYQGIGYEALTSEYDVGIRLNIDHDNTHWATYLGMGVAFIDHEIKASSIAYAQSGSEIGYWLNAGIHYRLNRTWNIGLDYRYVDTFNDTRDNLALNPTHYFYGLAVGYHW